MDAVIVRQFGMEPYQTVYNGMLRFTESRHAQSPDEIWLVEHPPVFTLGRMADRTHILDAGQVPVVGTDRGGEVTYHGPGQAVIYLLLDLRKRFSRLWIHDLVFKLEASVLQVLAQHRLRGERRPGAPGIYMPACQGAKIAALGLKINRKGCTYHGFALNVDMDLAPFNQINPCGYPGLAVTDMKAMGAICQVKDIQSELVKALANNIGFVVKEESP